MFIVNVNFSLYEKLVVAESVTEPYAITHIKCYLLILFKLNNHECTRK